MSTLAFHWTDVLVLAVACASLAWLAMEDVFEAPRSWLARTGQSWRESYSRPLMALGFIMVGSKRNSGITGCIVCLGVWINLAAYPLFVWLSGAGWSSAEWWQHGATFLVLAFATYVISMRREPAAPSITVNCPQGS